MSKIKIEPIKIEYKKLKEAGERKIHSASFSLQKSKLIEPKPIEIKQIEPPKQIEPKSEMPKIEKEVIKVEELIKSSIKDICYIIGGGPSVNEINVKNLKGTIITINKSVELLDECDYYITMDYTTISQNKVNLNNTKIKEKIFILNLSSGALKTDDGINYYDSIFNIKYDLSSFNTVIKSNFLIYNNTFGNSIETFSHGNNSGYCAIQFALLKDFKEINLIGFDMNSNNGTHYHNSYKLDLNKFEKNINSFKETLIESLKNYNSSKIKSCSINSSLNSVLEFKKINKMVDFIVVGYYTKNTPYEQEKDKLVESCKKFNIKHHIKGVDNLGSWQANTRYKAVFLLECLNQFNENLLYVDCDAIFHRNVPEFRDYNCDIAVRTQTFKWRKDECLSGTIFLKNNDKIKTLLKIWNDINVDEGNNTTNLEQWNLSKAIEIFKQTNTLDVINLEPQYVYIYDTFFNMFPNIKPVIEHFQASRKLKNKIHF